MVDSYAERCEPARGLALNELSDRNGARIQTCYSSRMRPRTMADHVETTRVRVSPGPDHPSEWHVRLNGLRFDGRRLSEHLLTDEKEPNKRLNEMLGLGHSLVGCGADFEIAEIRSLQPREGRATADFEATLRTAGTVRIELCRLADRSEKQYQDALNEIWRRTNEALRSTPDVLARLGTEDTFFVRFYDDVPTSKDIAPAARELTALILDEGGRIPRTASMRRAGAHYPTLHRLGTNWTRLPDGENVGLRIDPLLHVVGRPNPKAAFRPMLAKKAEKFTSYSDDGIPVWLAFYVDSQIGVATAYATVEEIERDGGVDPSPFERVLVGCLTKGVTFKRC